MIGLIFGETHFPKEILKKIKKRKSRYLIIDLTKSRVFKKDRHSNAVSIGQFGRIIKILKENNFPTQKIKNYYYFQIGRWDVELNNNKLLKFPKEKIDSAVLQSINLLDREDFKNYNTIDFRIYGKIIVE